MTMIVDALVSQFVETLATMGKEEVAMLLGAEDASWQLEEEVRAFSDLLRDAELRAFTDTAVRRWLADIKDFVYNADDIIDYSRTQAEKLARLSSEHPVLCYSPMLSFFGRVALRHRAGNSIRRVNERLERIRKRESGLMLIAAPRDDRGSSSRIVIQRQTDSLLEPDIVGSGIEDDTSYLVGLLTRKLVDGPRIPILAITGMGGVGKTTLAQKIYNHKTIKNNYWKPPPMWVCVSKEYTDENLLSEVVKCAGGNPGREHSFAGLQRSLASVIEGKRFFLILDDVWSAKVWVDLLRKPLQNGAAGSRVLITTRHQSVAKQMGAMHLHPVHPLTANESWALLCKLVFQDGIGDGGVETVRDIGRQIAERCGGLPLAIKTIAGVLMTKSRTRREWEMVLKNPAWSLDELPDGVMGVLYLSYQDLLFQLKQCFIFCSLFPEDHVFMRHTLTQLWVAEGFIAEKGDLKLEEVADNYYQELITRSLLQPHPDPEYADDDGACKMHDLLRSLAQFLARDEYGDMSQLVKNTTTTTTTTTSSSSSMIKLRHLSSVNVELGAVAQVVKEQESLRTLLLMGHLFMKDAPEVLEHVTENLFKNLRCSRVLDFSPTKFKTLPKSVGNIIHLRYLDLSGSSFVKLPKTIENLSNLQYLILQRCLNLSKLPRGTAKLYRLRSLDLEGSPVAGLPAGIRRLQLLNRLIGFVTNENKDGGWCSLEELSSLSQLRTLTIQNLERALISGQPRGFLIKKLRCMRHLKLQCKPYGDDDWDIYGNELVPPPSLERFEIDGFLGLEFPSWLMTDLLLPNLTRLELVNCKYLKQLPALGQLPNLDFLTIRGAISVEIIGSEFMGMGVGALAFPKLTTLNLEDMSNLVEWQWEVEDGVVAMPRLEILKIFSCLDLRSLPSGLGSVTALTTLSIEYAHSLSVIENLHSLKVVKVFSNDHLERVSNLSALQNMDVTDCYALRQVEGLHSLQSLNVVNSKVESLPMWLLLEGGQPAFPMLQRLHISVAGVFVLRKCVVDGKDWPKIQHYPQVDITCLDGENTLFVRYTRDPLTFNTNLDSGGSGSGDNGATADHEN